MQKIKYFSTFSGIGGFELGFGSKAQCVGFSEINAYATQIYQRHFPSHKNFGDITRIDARRLPNFDVLVGGFPCQAFSTAGKRKGFQDTRGTLFFELARILRVKRPRLFLFENVKGLLSHDHGQTFKVIVNTLVKLGYDLQWQVLNSKNHGVPQNRERVFIVGHLANKSRPKVFPFTGNDQENSRLSPRKLIDGAQATRVYSTEGTAVTLNSTCGGLGAKTGLYAVKIKEATKKGFAEAKVGQAINLSYLNSRTKRGRVRDISHTLDTTMQVHTLTKDMRIRRLTPTECERLQGFPTDWTAGISDYQRYRCLGNAVTVNVVTAIIRRMIQ